MPTELFGRSLVFGITYSTPHRRNATYNTEAEQIAACTQNGYAVGYIESPTEAVQMAAVMQNRWLIRYIKNPGEAVQLAARSKNEC